MRKSILLLILATTAQWAQARVVCGMYLIEDYTNIEVRSLTNLTSSTGRQIHYTIENPTDESVQTMLTGVCYCVSGAVSEDPSFAGDRDFRLIHVERVNHRCR